MNTPAPADRLKAVVRQKYAEIVTTGTSCCGPDGINMIGDAYEGVEGVFAEANLGLGCGLPVEIAGIQPGATVLDLGSGAGIDAFLARREVGETGYVIGLDFTPEMVAKARRNAASLGYANVTFVEGDIEAMPLRDETVDVVVSNCVLNLVPDKGRAFAEMYRVLRPGGHFCVSDIVSVGDLPAELQHLAEMYAGCVSGAIDRDKYLDSLRATGFVDVEIARQRQIAIPETFLSGLTDESAALLRDGGLWSVTLRGVRPRC